MCTREAKNTASFDAKLLKVSLSNTMPMSATLVEASKVVRLGYGLSRRPVEGVFEPRKSLGLLLKIMFLV